MVPWSNIKDWIAMDYPKNTTSFCERVVFQNSETFSFLRIVRKYTLFTKYQTFTTKTKTIYVSELNNATPIGISETPKEKWHLRLQFHLEMHL